MKTPALRLALALAATIGAGACAAQGVQDPQEAHDGVLTAVSADAAEAALLRGASVVDIRPVAEYAAGHLPRAVSARALAGATELRQLERLVSESGIDLSREVVLVGQPGDPLAQALQSRLQRYATGRVHWLVGGAHEWSLSGRALQTHATVLAPVPQYLVPLAPQAAAPRMAGANLRDAVAVPAAVASSL